MPSRNTADTPAAAQDRFFALSLDKLLTDQGPEHADNAVLALFHRTVAEVPAYRHFLEQQGVDPASVRAIEDFRALPLTTKPNYMHAYPLPERCPGGTLLSCDRVAVSSGSTGLPTFWPRSYRHELDISLRFEQVFRDSFRAHERSTLAVVCFALGTG